MPEPLHFIDGEWIAGNPPILGPMSHATWMASVVFDGARSFEGTAPDLDRHCARVVQSAQRFGLAPTHDAVQIEMIARDGIAKFAADTALYVRPMFFAERGFVSPDPESTRFVLTLAPTPMPEPKGMKICLANVRRPLPDTAPTDTKASCLYPNAARGLIDAARRGFDNGVVLDAIGNVAEMLTANLFLAKDGIVATPIANGTFLAGITRQRTLELLRDAGVPVVERVVTWDEILAADEIFSVGNYGKILPITRIEDRDLQPGPVYRRARDLYWAYAHDAAARP